MTAPLQRVQKAVKERSSNLCVSIDPDPEVYRNVGERHRLCMYVLEEVAESAAAVKVNENFVRGFSLEMHHDLTGEALRKGLVTIYDCKMGDIENTNRAGLATVKQLGYDFVTFNPILGNLGPAAKAAKELDVGVLALLHPSNPSSNRYYRATLADGRMLYQHILDDVVASDVEGVVLGLHTELSDSEVLYVRERIGLERVILFPGVGVQGGDPLKACRYGGVNILVNVGRAVTQSPNPRKTAAEIAEMLKKMSELTPE